MTSKEIKPKRKKKRRRVRVIRSIFGSGFYG